MQTKRFHIDHKRVTIKLYNSSPCSIQSTNLIYINSFRKGSKKYVFVSKKNQDQFEVNQASLSLCEPVRTLLKTHATSLLELTAKDRDELTPKIQKPNSMSID